jgi:hypothetical protein
MAKGDAYAPGIEAVAGGGTYYHNMRPSVQGIEVIVHNIGHSTDAVLEYFDSVSGLSVIVDTQTGNDYWAGMFLRCTYDRYYRVRNSAAGVNNIFCNGVVSRQE